MQLLRYNLPVNGKEREDVSIHWQRYTETVASDTSNVCMQSCTKLNMTKGH